MRKDEEIKQWYESYKTPPPWSSVAGYIIRRDKELQIKWYDAGYDDGYLEARNDKDKELIEKLKIIHDTIKIGETDKALHQLINLIKK